MDRVRDARRGGFSNHPRKGTNHSGGGGHKGGGGKKSRPAQGWEKGDVVRNIDDLDSPYAVKAKPGPRKKLMLPSIEESQQKLAGLKIEKEALRARGLFITVQSEDLLITATWRRIVQSRLTTLLDEFEKIKGAIVTFEKAPRDPESSCKVLCTIKIKLRRMGNAKVEFGGENLKQAYEGALGQIEESIRQSYNATARRTRRRQGEPVSRRFHRAKKIGVIQISAD